MPGTAILCRSIKKHDGIFLPTPATRAPTPVPPPPTPDVNDKRGANQIYIYICLYFHQHWLAQIQYGHMRIYIYIYLHRAMLRYELSEFKPVISYHIKHPFIRACVNLQFRSMTLLWDQARSLIMSSDEVIEYVLQLNLQWQFPDYTVHAAFNKWCW